MTFEQSFTLAIIGGVFGLLAFSRIAPDIVMLAGLTLLLVTGVLSTSEALSGFANEGMITVGVLYVVVAGLRDTAAMSWVTRTAFGRPSSVAAAQTRMMLPLAAASAFMNNTPLVAAMMPAVSDWARKLAIPASKLMMPLSFATILGGLCTVIGTSTNVIVAGLSRDAVHAGAINRGIEFFTLAPIGVPCALAGLAYILLASRWLLPARGDAIGTPDDPRAYTVEMLVKPGGGITGLTIEEAGLRHLRSMYLAEVERDGEIIAAVSPNLRLQDNDRLVFVGIVDSVMELQRTRGLMPATDQLFKLDTQRTGRVLIEAVVSLRCPLIGKSIREGRFRTQYSAVVIAAARSGQRLRAKIGDIVLEPGDTLLLEARPAFLQQHRDSQDFYLVSELPDSAPPRHEKALIALAILIGMVVLASLFEQHPLFAARGLGVLHAVLLAAGLMLATGCCSVESARRTVDWQVLLVIAAAIGIGKALTATGLATAGAGLLVELVGPNPWLNLAAVYLTTMILTELLSNNTAAVLMFPIALATAATAGVEPMPFIVATTIAASCGFATPIGYQTNLIVCGPGGYRFSDYLRFGGPLNLVVATVVVVFAPIVFPFSAPGS